MARGERVSTLHASPDSTTRLMRGVALGLVAVLGLVGWARWQGLPSDAPTARVQQEVALHFRDRADGSVEVKEATRGEPLARFTGEQGFLRGTLRALARERRRHGVDEAPPVLLRRYDDDRLVLFDPSTQLQIDLGSFGPSNKAVFSPLVSDSPRSSP